MVEALDRARDTLRDIDIRINGENRAPHWQFNATPRHAIEVNAHHFRREILNHLAETTAQTEALAA
jgi:hypothetical protein